ncbi:fungal-specific transcription factor domain-containing protein [Xylaria bambusicola]|uniref:fungal-specific transcription factor domain-containing protein n=1 Tax=Xylaria bambusicola TaxID=326684 RepID=UPI002007BF1D|nr:fungal-specific transcription factor domain-containing protein [Xylaria bambusicola]KAI0521553.1 fungal-specific transcription factor domain-containing protein [Xylaria bambusicola]
MAALNMEGNGPRRGSRRVVRREQNSRRTGLSCRRCQKRKIRCNGELPRCQSCAKVGVNCEDGESLKARPLPRAYLKSLCNRIEWLETLVRIHCPNIDLERDGPLVVDAPQTCSGTGPEDDDTLTIGDSSQQLNEIPEVQPDLDVLPGTETTITKGPATAGNEATGLEASEIPSSAGLSHEVGLVSLGANRDPRYIGPSSGYVFCKLMLAASSRAGKMARPANSLTPSVAPYLRELVIETQGPISITQDQATNLCQTYFDIIHVQYPFLHYPTFLQSLRRFFECDSPDHIAGFQTYMVLAISATIVSRLQKIPLSGERYYMTALQYFEKIQVESSIQGLQCILLLLIFAMQSSTVRLDVWCLNYQCIASVLDLGLQRAVTGSSGISKLDLEMRTRIFWVVYTLDRTIATMMGRPIGLRDEACDFRLPADLSDADIGNESIPAPTSSNTSTHMTYAIHLFKLAKINSEIKYVANSVNPNAPSYAYPAIIDINAWQRDVLAKLDQWAASVPAARNANDYSHAMLLLRYHSVRMLLLRPSPNIPRPDHDALRHCYSSAEESIQLHSELYKKNLLVHNWITFHSAVLSTIAMFYCILSVPSIATMLEVEDFMSNVRASLNVLSAIGEHYSGAKRSRDILDELAGPISRWLLKKRREEAAASLGQSAIDNVSRTNIDLVPATIQPVMFDDTPWPSLWSPFDGGFDGQWLSESYGSADCANLDGIMLSLLDDFT